MEIVEGIHQIEGTMANVYLTVNGNKLTLIDTGFMKNAGKIEDYIENLGFELSSVSTIILTHFHIDHTANAKKLKEKTGAKIAVHEADADYVTHKKAPPKPKKLLSRAMGIIKAAPVEPDILLKDGDMIEGLKVIHVPGHTPGSIALFYDKRKVMFVGDTIFYAGGNVEGPVESYAWDLPLALESLGRFLDYDFEVMLGGHKEPLTTGASEKVKVFVESLKK